MATTRYPLTKDAWTDCGSASAPCFIQSVSSDAVLFVINTTAPSSLDADAHVLWDRDRTANVGMDGQKIFARAGTRTAALVISR